MLPLDAYRESFVNIAGRNLAWLDWGAHWPGAPVVCLHGAMSQSHVWDHLAAGLSDSRRVIAPDLRGHGDSEPAVPPAYALQHYRDDVVALMDRIQAGRFSVVGHSMGAVLGLILAGAYPDRIERLVVVDHEAKQLRAHREHLHAVGTRGHNVLPDYESMDKVARAFAPDVGDELLDWLMPYLFRRVPGGYMLKWDPTTLTMDDEWNAEPWLARIRCPVLLVRGAESNVMRADVAESMAKRIDDCQVVTITGAGHQVMLQQPRTFEAVVSSFLMEPSPV